MYAVLTRLELGLAVRKAGALYPQAIQLAVSHMILDVLAREHSNWIGKRSSAVQDDERSAYYRIFDTLVSLCDVPKMDDAIENFRVHGRTSESSSVDVEELNALLLGVMGGSNVQDILSACNMLLEALTLLDLTECYKLTPLLAGDQIKQVLKNIPKGTMFGEVRAIHVVSVKASVFYWHVFCHDY